MDLFVIPTHRLCEKAVKSIIEEIKSHAANELGILILDNSKDEIYKENHSILKELKENNDIAIFHVGLEEMREILFEISKKCILSYDELVEMFYPDKIDYGKVFNFIYLLATLYGADRIHRRDSDCFVWGLEQTKYPYNPERLFLGKNVNSIKNINKQEDISYDNDEKIYIVGGDYTGNWDLDMQEVNEANPKAMKKMMLICGISEEDINKQFDIKYNEEDENDLPVLSSLFEASQLPECGNISMHEIFKYIPNFVGENGIGFDNHTYFISFQVKAPIIYHFNRIVHMHDANRTKDIDLMSYWKGIAKMVDFDTYHLEFIESNYIDIICKNGYGIKSIKESYEEVLPNLLEKTHKQLNYEVRVKRIESIAEDILRPTGIAIYMNIADYLQEEKHNIIKQLDYEYALSIKIQRNWKTIISILEQISNTNKVLSSSNYKI